VARTSFGFFRSFARRCIPRNRHDTRKASIRYAVSLGVSGSWDSGSLKSLPSLYSFLSSISSTLCPRVSLHVKGYPVVRLLGSDVYLARDSAGASASLKVIKNLSGPRKGPFVTI
jgi:hypothetical protein